MGEREVLVRDSLLMSEMKLSASQSCCAADLLLCFEIGSHYSDPFSGTPPGHLPDRPIQTSHAEHPDSG